MWGIQKLVSSSFWLMITSHTLQNNLWSYTALFKSHKYYDLLKSEVLFYLLEDQNGEFFQAAKSFLHCDSAIIPAHQRSTSRTACGENEKHKRKTLGWQALMETKTQNHRLVCINSRVSVCLGLGFIIWGTKTWSENMDKTKTQAYLGLQKSKSCPS